MYTLINSKGCCGTCNYTKKEYKLEDLIDKMLKIYNNHFTGTLINYLQKNNIKDVIIQKKDVKIHTQTKKERTNAANERKKLQRQRLVEQYGDELYKKIHACEVSIVRAKKSNMIDKIKELQANLTNLKSNTSVNHNIDNMSIKPVKKSKESKRNDANERKKLQRQRLVEKYGDELYKNIHSCEVAITRAKKKNDLDKVKELELKLIKLKE
jgi:activator of HSP90 ATPase